MCRAHTVVLVAVKCDKSALQTQYEKYMAIEEHLPDSWLRLHKVIASIRGSARLFQGICKKRYIVPEAVDAVNVFSAKNEKHISHLGNLSQSNRYRHFKISYPLQLTTTLLLGQTVSRGP